MPSVIQNQFRSANVTTAAKFTITTSTSQVLVGWNLITKGTSNAYLKLYNAQIANVTVGTTTPVRTLLIPAGGTALLSNENEFQLGFNLGMVGAVTGDLLDSDTSAPSGACYVEILYNTNT